MLIVFDSRTGNVKRFVAKLGMRNIQLESYTFINEPFILITYTTSFGGIPEKTLKFLENNHEHLVAVSASGNRNWGQSYAKSADTISDMYNVPVLSKFELSGTARDVAEFRGKVQEIERY